MRHKKTDFLIIFQDHNKFSIKVRKPFLKFFYRWVPVMFQEAENTDEQLLTFDSFEAATNFIDLVYTNTIDTIVYIHTHQTALDNL